MMTFLSPSIVAPPFIWLAEIGVDKSRLGIHAQDGWCMRIRDELVFFHSEKSCMVLLPLLEIERSKFFNFLENLEENQRNSAIENFPEHLLLLYAFKYEGSDYWAEKAFDWIGENKNILLRIKDDLEALVKTQKLSQRLTHKIAKLLISVKHPKH